MKQLLFLLSFIAISSNSIAQNSTSYSVSGITFIQSSSNKSKYDIYKGNTYLGFYELENDDFYNLYDSTNSYVAKLNFDNEYDNIELIKKMNNKKSENLSNSNDVLIPTSNLLKKPQSKYYYYKQPVSSEVMVYEGYSFDVESKNYVTSKSIEEGDSVVFIIASDYYINGIQVFKKGTDVVAYISDAERAGILGKKGSLVVQLCYTWAINGTRINLRAKSGRMEGNSKTGEALILSALTVPIFLLKKGSNVKFSAGYTMKAYVLRDVILKP